jgi:hypothetical protein
MGFATSAEITMTLIYVSSAIGIMKEVISPEDTDLCVQAKALLSTLSSSLPHGFLLHRLPLTPTID